MIGEGEGEIGGELGDEFWSFFLGIFEVGGIVV